MVGTAGTGRTAAWRFGEEGMGFDEGWEYDAEYEASSIRSSTVTAERRSSTSA